MSGFETILSKQEKKWILDRRITRLSDNKEVQIYPMGAERYLASVLAGNQKKAYDIRTDIEGKNVLVIPGYGNSSFLFAQAGAQAITAYDKDPVTIAWMKAFKKYYLYCEYDKNGNPLPSIGELFAALTCWYPPLLTLVRGKFINFVSWIINPNALRRSYIHYMVELVQHAIQLKNQSNYELDKNIQFKVGTLDKLLKEDKNKTFDTAFVPYLLGVQNGVENENEIVQFLKQLIKIIPEGHILVSPSRDIKEYPILGKSYFITTGYSEIQEIPALKDYVIGEDKNWFRTQGLALFGMQHR
ncbi:ABC transporter permease [Fluoribacter dumoffii]|uniref:ABC transporter permease n=1 Tax=Fluoribacter dumoffii TaxID=463 RepID=UPI002242EF83|nr:ABC transporter permease [Fluoribacter dumoffii]MCW8418690.1 ABC transporter permease [Fluoribacter dumoffii]MCW8453466.1 ABC transporter permease [Fluoribacter dumoffii]MCW8459314.1 ABC transporter permease [Fluoribacter dumoffii]MCW8482673.1 ABC transporter permease [Fluoribacter dumoffii]